MVVCFPLVAFWDAVVVVLDLAVSQLMFKEVHNA